MAALDAFNKLADFFDVPITEEVVGLDTHDQYYDIKLRTIICDAASRNANLIPFGGVVFWLETFILGPFSKFMPNGGIPQGHQEEEFKVAFPLPLPDNDSFNSYFIRKSHYYILPALKKKYPNIPLIFENKYGLVHLCIMIHPQNLCRNGVINQYILSNILQDLRMVCQDIEPLDATFY